MSLNRGIFYTFLTQAPNLLLFFVASTLMTRVLGDEGRGAYALLQNQTVLFSMLLGFNLGFGITYFTSRTKAIPPGWSG
ncbi:MAG: oligosaccharide flippase family protein [Flavobacteriales bacterium]|nr:oligosaccharide flippase family protein [Flavobacteriales bacterium]